LNLSAAHAMQGPPSALVWPALHWQAVSATLPACESECAGQPEHSAGPVVFLKVLAAHSEQDPPLSPVYPGSHVQSFTVSLPATELALGPHAAHSRTPEGRRTL